MIRTPDQRLRVFVSSTLGELATERAAVRRAIERLRLSPVMFELGARPHPPRELYRAYLAQSDIFIGMYWQRYGWVAPGETISGLEDEYRLAGELPQLVYLKEPAPDREERLDALLDDIRDRDRTSYRHFRDPDELEELVSRDLAVLLSERFATTDRAAAAPRRAPAPRPLTPIIGREDVVADVIELLDGGVRLVTVTGPGGVGKTRVALEAARGLDARGGLPVHFVGLATVSSPSLAMSTIADQMGARGMTTRGPVDALVAHFGDGPALLVLDNVEQVIDVGDELAQLLERAPGVQVLVTSRQALRVRGEHELVVAPLDVPAAGDAEDAIGRAAAVRLFLDRARALGRPVRLDRDNAQVIAELCRRVGGLPLAIELVVARLRLLTPRMLLDRLGTALDLPTPRGDLPSRQRTLRATLDWSHDLLDERERTLFARMSVFPGGATLDAIEDVCATDDGEVLDALAGLMDKSLVLAGDQGAGDDPRFRMLEPVRAYATERLDATGEAEPMRRRHLDHFSRLGREAQPYLCGPGQRRWAARFDAERANMRAAVAAGVAAGEIAIVLRLVWDTLVYYYIRDAIDEPRQWMRAVAERRAALDATGEALLDVGLVIVGDSPIAGEVADVLGQAAQVFDDGGLDLEAAVSCHYLGLHHWQAGDVVQAVQHLEASSARYAAIDHDWGVAIVEAVLGVVRAGTGDGAAGSQHLERSLVHARRIDNRPLIAQALHGLALVDAVAGRLDAARDRLDEAAEIALVDRSVTAATYCLDVLAVMADARGDVEEAARLVGAARGARRRLAIPSWTAAADLVDATVRSIEADLPADRRAAAFAEHADGDVLALLDADVRRHADVPAGDAS
jgi:predicted ATPase